ncbi:MAG: DUF3794 domain-containing protein [Clostridia bacterium]|nr:DUF3794 domain-containing protein [Clostridia bacterium]
MMSSIELVRDMMTVDQIVAEDISQTLIEGDIVISEIDPEIQKVLSIQADVKATGKEVLQDKVMIDGTVNFDVLYMAADEENSIRSTKGECDFSHVIEQGGIKPKMRVDISFDVEHLDYFIEGGRKINAKAVVNIKGQIVDTQQVEFIKDVEGLEDVQKLDDSIAVASVIGEDSSQTMVKEDLEIPDTNPPVKVILKKDVRIKEKEASISEGKVIVRGSIALKTLYLADNEQSSLETVEHEISFSHLVEIEDALPYMRSTVDVMVDDVYLEVRENPLGETTILDAEIILTVFARVLEEQTVDILCDIYSPSITMDIDTKKISSRQLAASCSDVAHVKQLVDVAASNLYDINAKAVLTDYSIEEGEVVVEGIINAGVLYSKDSSGETLESLKTEVPFRHVIEVEDIYADMDAEIQFGYVNVEYQPFSKTQVEINYQFFVDVMAYERSEKWVIVSVEKGEDRVDQEERSAITIYFVQPGDTLWEIAKKYKTTIDEIIETNEIEESENIEAGMKIIIYRGEKYKVS